MDHSSFLVEALRILREELLDTLTTYLPAEKRETYLAAAEKVVARTIVPGASTAALYNTRDDEQFLEIVRALAEDDQIIDENLDTDFYAPGVGEDGSAREKVAAHIENDLATCVLTTLEHHFRDAHNLEIVHPPLTLN